MKKIVCFILVLSGCFLQMSAAGEVDLLQQANQLYSEGEYRQAAELYEQLLEEKGVAPELFYNLGNAYFKSNEVGLSILNYERALRLNPRFDDARYNLQLAQTKVIDDIPPAQVFFVKRWIQALVSRYTSNQWLYASSAMFVLCLAGCLLFVFARSRGVRKAAFVLGVVMLVFSACSLVCSLTRKSDFLNHREAIVMTGIITVKSSPDRSGTDLFELHEGTKVSLKSTLGEWVEIVIGDGRMGWAEQKHLEKI